MTHAQPYPKIFKITFNIKNLDNASTHISTWSIN